jgi:hypothetical protein
MTETLQEECSVRLGWVRPKSRMKVMMVELLPRGGFDSLRDVVEE